MFEKLFKKKPGLPEIPKTDDDGNAEEITAPEVEETINEIDAALDQAERLSKAADEERKTQERLERLEKEINSGSRCGCGW